jgi:hypothetical protein
MRSRAGSPGISPTTYQVMTNRDRKRGTPPWSRRQEPDGDWLVASCDTAASMA